MFIELNRRTGTRMHVAADKIVSLTDARVRNTAVVKTIDGETFEANESVESILERLSVAAPVADVIEGETFAIEEFDFSEFVTAAQLKSQLEEALKAKETEVNNILADLGFEAGVVLSLVKRVGDVEELLTAEPAAAATGGDDAPPAEQKPAEKPVKTTKA